MARYMETAADLAKEVEAFINGMHYDYTESELKSIAGKLGHIINLAIRACPRGVQHTVRLNIVREAVGKYCRVTMTEELDERTQRTYHKIHIEPRK